LLEKKGEEAKIAVRSIRRDANDQYKKLKKDSKITEDELRIAEEEIQELTNDHTKEIDKIVEAKEEEIMEV
jgi:ribosome recycling factor